VGLKMSIFTEANTIEQMILDAVAMHSGETPA